MDCVTESVPSILSTYRVTVFRMLWEGDVDSNERRAILQHDTTSNHGYPAGKTKKQGGNKREGDTQREGKTGLQ